MPGGLPISGIRRHRRLLATGWLALLVTASDVVQVVAAQETQRQRSSAVPTSSSPQRALLDRYCVTCHNERRRLGGLALDTVDVANVSPDAVVWEKVIRKVRLGAMPPPGMPRPDQSAYDAFASYLERSLDRAAAVHPNPGRTDAIHRLDRTEYRNAIRDLLEVEIDVTSLLPPDAADENGFNNIAEILSLSPVLLERYMGAARKISRLAVGRPPSAPVVEKYNVPVMLIQDDRLAEDLPFGSRGGVAFRHYFPVDGEYSIKITLQKNQSEYVRGMRNPQELEIRLDKKRIKSFTVGGGAKGRPAAPGHEGSSGQLGSPEWDQYLLHADKGLEFRFPARAGPRLIGVSFVKKSWELEGVPQPRQVGYALVVNAEYDGLAAVESVAIDGPFKVSGPGDTRARRSIFVCQPVTSKDEEPCARKILSALARRAFRRPVTDADVQPLLSLYRANRMKEGFESGIQFALERILVDPEFVFRIERDPAAVAPATVYRISGVELASRLSFFLWSSIPDNELLDLAARGKLRAPAVLEQQVRRMLRDARSKALSANFGGQWLELPRIRSVMPDPVLFSDFDENLRQALQWETELFLDSIMREDRNVADLLSANYTFVNERLARHYGIPNVYGNRFRRVTLRTETRGGLLGHGSLLTLTSYPTRTSPVLRGKWLLSNILGSPPPPPPANVPNLPDRGEDGQHASVRERLERHRKNPICAACHSQMDALGFALENFDAVGRWQTTGEGLSAIDATGTSLDGSKFEGIAGLRALLLRHRDQFVGTVTEKLLSYALGRSVGYADRPVIRQVMRKAAQNDYRWSAIVLGIVQSTPFQMRRSPS